MFKNKMSIPDLKAEAVLDSTIQFPHPLCANWAQPKAVFLTGATGFLGVYLLDELLRQTSADIYCLIRGDTQRARCDADAAKARLKRQLQFYGLFQAWEKAFQERVIPVVGDLSKARFALSEGAFGELAGQIEVIYHNGAQVNVMYPYARLKASNVLGTQEILRLAGLKQTKPVHFISTLGVFFSDAYCERVVLESDIANADSSLKGGYKQSKWVAEELVRLAKKRGLPATIYRPGRIWGDRQSGIMTRFSDLLCNLLQVCIHLGKFPAVETTLNIIPVDYASQAIVHLAQQERSFGQVFHLCNPQPIEWKKMWQIVSSFAYPLQEISYQQWAHEVKRQATQQRKNKLYSILRHLLRSPIYMFAKKPQFDARQTQAALADASIVCPSIDAKLMATYLSYFQESGYIPAASRQTRTAQDEAR